MTEHDAAYDSADDGELTARPFEAATAGGEPLAPEPGSRAARKPLQDFQSRAPAATIPSHIRITPSSPPLSVRFCVLDEHAPDVASACTHTSQLAVHAYDSAAVRSVAAWMEACYNAWVAQDALEALRTEQRPTMQALASLDARALACVFAHRDLMKSVALLTYSGDKKGSAGAKGPAPPPKPPPRHGGSDPNSLTYPFPPVTRDVPVDDEQPKKEDSLFPEQESESEEEIIVDRQVVDGKMLDSDCSDAIMGRKGKERFEELYCRYKTNLLKKVKGWQRNGVSSHELLNKWEVEARENALNEKVEAASAAESKAAAAADACVEGMASDGSPKSFATLRLAHHLGLDILVRRAVAAMAPRDKSLRIQLTVESATDLLLLAADLRCPALRDRVSGFLLNRWDDVCDSPEWRKLVPPAEHNRLVALWAAMRANPLGGFDLEAVGPPSDVRELVALMRETLFDMEERLVEAKEQLAADEDTATYDHAQKGLRNAVARIEELKRVIAQHEDSNEGVRLEYRAPDRLMWACASIDACGCCRR
jgi:hypothetical protein